MEAAIHKRNTESSILFMQQEHATTLKALHEEIQKLQKKCTDLTFQLTMHGISVDDQGDVDSGLQQVQQQLQQSQQQESTLQRQLAAGALRLQELEQELRVQQKKHADEMRQAAHAVSSLRAEVEAKSNNIAFLTTELHRLKVKQKEGGAGAGVREHSGGIIRRTQPQYSHLPAPPRDLLTQSARLRNRNVANSSTARPAFPDPHTRRTHPSGGSASVSEAESGAAADLARSLRVTSASARSSGSESPDISPFVQREPDAGKVVVEVKKTAPLPPITPSSHHHHHHHHPPGLGERDAPLDKADLQQAAAAMMGHRGRRSVSRSRRATVATPPEVTSLAVDQVSDATWKRPSQSHSSEYN